MSSGSFVRGHIGLIRGFLNKLDKQNLSCLKRYKELKHRWDIIKRCTRQLALTVGRNVKFLSNQTEAGQCIAENVTLNEDLHEDIKL